MDSNQPLMVLAFIVHRLGGRMKIDIGTLAEFIEEHHDSFVAAFPSSDGKDLIIEIRGEDWFDGRFNDIISSSD